MAKMSFDKLDLISVIENEGGEPKLKGSKFWMLCLLHSERTPSFMIDPERQRWFCFGCNRGGDVIDFISLYKGLSFKDSLKYLGINGKPYKPDPKEVKKRQLLQRFKQWCGDYHNDLCTLYRTLQKAKEKIKNVEEAEAISGYYHRESKWLSHLEMLTGGSDRDKFQLYCQVVKGSS